MKHKVSELDGLLLDRAVGKAEGYEIDPVYGCNMTIRESGGAPSDWNPSTDWMQGGPIIERARLDIAYVWPADLCNEWGDQPPRPALWRCGRFTGPTPLIAAMRAYVASKFGDEIDL